MTDARDARLRRLYGITAEEYEKVLAFQGGGCALCGRKPGRTRLAVDHRHSDGLTRGLLCVVCNRAIREWMTREWMENAAVYMATPFNMMMCLGRQPQGVIGRVTTKRRRKKKGA